MSVYKKDLGAYWWYKPKGKKFSWRTCLVGQTTPATADLVNILAKQNPNATIAELQKLIFYDNDAKEILQKYIDKGLGNEIPDFGK